MLLANTKVVAPRAAVWIVLVIGVAVAAGCGHSRRSPTYSAVQVRTALESQGFDLRLALDKRPGASLASLNLVNLFPDLDGLQTVLADYASSGAVGGVISVWVFDTKDHAAALRGGIIRLQKGNLVVLTDAGHQRRANAALAHLD